MKLYVDGKRVGRDADTTAGQAYTGYWRVGGDNLERLAEPAGERLLRRRHRRGRGLPDRADAGAGRRRTTPPAAAPSTVPQRPADAYGAAVYDADPDLLLAPRRASGTDRDRRRSATARRHLLAAASTLGAPAASGGTSGHRGRLRRHADGVGRQHAVRQPDASTRGGVVQDHHDQRRQASSASATRRPGTSQQLRPARLHAERRPAHVRRLDRARPTPSTRRRPTTTASGTTWSPPRSATA